MFHNDASTPRTVPLINTQVTRTRLSAVSQPVTVTSSVARNCLGDKVLRNAALNQNIVTIETVSLSNITNPNSKTPAAGISCRVIEHVMPFLEPNEYFG